MGFDDQIAGYMPDGPPCEHAGHTVVSKRITVGADDLELVHCHECSMKFVYLDGHCVLWRLAE